MWHSLVCSSGERVLRLRQAALTCGCRRDSNVAQRACLREGDDGWTTRRFLMPAPRISRRASATAAGERLAARGLKPEQHKIYRASTPSSVRAIAEFEPMGGLLLAYPGSEAPPLDHQQLPPSGVRQFGVPDELIIRAQQGGTVHVFVLCGDVVAFDAAVDEIGATARSMSLPFDPALMHPIEWDTDTYWTRDYGPWWAAQDDGGICIAKHLYTSLGSGSVGDVEGDEDKPPRPRGGIFRPNDDYGADAFSDRLNAPILAWNAAHEEPELRPHRWYFMGLLDAGGDYMVDGNGIVASSYLVAEQAELPAPDATDDRMEYILAQMNRFLGVTQYWVLTDPTGTYIGHIDCFAKFLGPNSVLVAQSDDPTVNGAYDDVEAFFTDQGFAVTRVRCQEIGVTGADGKPTTAAYVNSLILNDEVYVPLAGQNFEDCDAAALAAYGAAMPDHHIIGIIGKPEAPWLGTDALHCRTHGVPKAAVDAWLASGGASRTG
jgi:agmatine deiminase